MAMKRLAASALNAARNFSVFGPEEKRTPPQELAHTFKAVVASIDALAERDVADPVESEKQLKGSKVAEQLATIVTLLLDDCDVPTSPVPPATPARSVGGNSSSSTKAPAATPTSKSGKFTQTCADVYLQHHVTHELCMRAIKDSPFGLLILVLDFLVRVLSEAPYPLLPHQTVHKPVANLITFCARYDALAARGAPAPAAAASSRYDLPTLPGCPSLHRNSSRRFPPVPASLQQLAQPHQEAAVPGGELQRPRDPGP